MERGSVIDSQITLLEEQVKELDRCRDWKYYYINYTRVVVIDGRLIFQGQQFESEAELHIYRRMKDEEYGIVVKGIERKYKY